jgi:hypothetical protein
MSVSPAVGVRVGGAGRLPLDGHPSPQPAMPAYAETYAFADPEVPLRRTKGWAGRRLTGRVDHRRLISECQVLSPRGHWGFSS